MNRDIKFRGKSIKNNEWVCGDLKHDKLNSIYYICMDDKNNEVNSETIGQFTGLIDEHGKEMYEGDIVSCVFFHYYGTEIEQHIKGIIEWFQGGFVIKVIENDFENAGQYSIASLNIDTTMQVEVIGNVYDNPELAIIDDGNEKNAD